MEAAQLGQHSSAQALPLALAPPQFVQSLAQGFTGQEVPLHHHKTTHRTTFLVPIMHILTLTPLLGKKDKTGILDETLEIIEPNNFCASVSAAGVGNRGDFPKVTQQKKKKKWQQGSLDSLGSCQCSSVRWLSFRALWVLFMTQES